jgi:dihydrofolate reductase
MISDIPSPEIDRSDAMRNVIMFNMVSLDGFFAGPNQEIDWFVFDEDLERYIKATQMMKADTLLFGRVTYEGMAAYWPSAEGDLADFMNKVPKVVFSRTLDKAEWNNSRLVKDNVLEEVSRLKQQPGKDIFLYGSADFASTLIQHGLVDEYRLGVNPVVLRGGTALFKGSPARLNLKLLEARPLTSGVVILHYKPE